jgi:DNA-binding response OmpR family regulator
MADDRLQGAKSRAPRIVSTHRHILVVENEPVTARILSRVLRSAGYMAVLASSCASARSLTQHFEVAVLDMDLGDGNGLSLAEELLASNRVRRVIFHTGTMDEMQQQKARRIGLLIVKSGNLQGLLAAIEGLLLDLKRGH